jgi:hypothetical protein
MAWKKYTPVAPSQGKPPVSIRIPDAASRAVPSISIDAATTKQLGWRDGATLQILIGEGDHDGKIRIEPMQGEPTKLSVPGSAAVHTRSRFRLGRMPGLIADEFKASLAFEIDRGGGRANEGSRHHAARRCPLASPAAAHGSRDQFGNEEVSA